MLATTDMHYTYDSFFFNAMRRGAIYALLCVIFFDRPNGSLFKTQTNQSGTIFHVTCMRSGRRKEQKICSVSPSMTILTNINVKLGLRGHGVLMYLAMVSIFFFFVLMIRVWYKHSKCNNPLDPIMYYCFCISRRNFRCRDIS